MAKNPYIAVIYYPTLINKIKCFSLGGNVTLQSYSIV